MPQYRIVKLKNLTPLHIGIGREEYDVCSSELHSDTLSSALASLYVQQGGQRVEQFLESFIISSCFPFWEDLLFFPRPASQSKLLCSDEKEDDMRKRTKRIRYIEFSLWQKMITGKQLSISTDQISDDLLWDSPDYRDNIFTKKDLTQRVCVSRDGIGDAAPFYFDRLHFKAEAGLFCLLQSTPAMENTIIRLFELLGQTGLGTDKNIGCGQFEIEMADITIEEANNATGQLILSLFIPTKQEMSSLSLCKSSYQLLRRGGYMAGSNIEAFRHLRKRAVYAFSEGSVLLSSEPLKGKIVDITPSWDDEQMHPVYRNGRPLAIGIKCDIL